MRTRNYITRTIQGIYEENGGYGQPITIKRLTEDGVSLQVWTGTGWADVNRVSISGEIAVMYCPKMDVNLRTKYTDAVKVRVTPDADSG